MKRQRYRPCATETIKVACTVSAAALMLGASHGATVGFNFQCNYCSAHSYSGSVVTAPAFGIAPSGWESLSQMDTGYGCTAAYFTLTNVINTSSSTGGLNPLPNGSVTVVWSAYTANVSGFGGYDRSPPHYTFGGNGYRVGEEQVYWGFLRDGVNFGPGSSGGDNNQPGYSIDITGLKSLFTNSAFAVELIGSADSMQYLTNAFVIDATRNSTQSVIYPSTPPVGDVGDTAWIRGIGGGLSTASGSLDTDHIQIIGNRAAHGGDKVTGFNAGSSIAGFIITDIPVISMAPQPVLVYPGDTVVWSAYAVGVPPLAYQWRKNGVPIPGATTDTLGLTNVGMADVANYDLLVTNSYGSTVSPAVTIDHLTIAQGNNYVVDSNPSNPPLDGLDFGATWLASSGSHTGVMSFNATNGNQIVVPASTNFNSSVGAIMFWMRSSGPTNSASGAAILFDRQNLVIAQNTNGTLQVNTPNGAGPFDSSSTVLSDGNWHHVAVVFDQSLPNGVVQLYVDGQPDNGTLNTSAWAWPARQELEFGLSHNIASWQAYNGLMDDIRYYSRVLTAAEVLSIFNTGSTVDNTTLMLRLNFDTAPVEGVTITWLSSDSVLQSSSTASGGYTSMPYALSPFATSLRTATKYFRYQNSNHTPQTIIANPYLM